MEDIRPLDGVAWPDIELKDVRTGEIFKISDFDKPVLLETFAVWCPTCRKQQDHIKALHKEIGDAVISISLDTDPSEDEAKVLTHINRYNYDWFYAVDTGGFAKQLVDEYGINVVNAPSAPVILICEDDSRRLLKYGLKDKEELKTEIERGC